jgi:MoaA/NifB/PqqE/SkfB family radical SAM enzyme
MSNYLTSKSFCILPFIEDFQDLSVRTKRFCCYGTHAIDQNLHSDSNNQLRKQILDGVQIPQCTSCYNLDSKKIISPRLRETSRWLKQQEVKQYIDNWSETQPLTFFYDLRFDNKCNLACIGCDPTYSSLWAKELGIKQPIHTTNVDLEKISQAKKIYLAGGEPLIIEQFVDIIKAISLLDIQPELVINTNLTSINDRLKLILANVKNLTLAISVDAFDTVNEYHRWPLKWNKFLNNLKWARDNLSCTIYFNTVVDAVTVINVDQLIAIEEYADQWNLSILTQPAALQICNLPTKLKSEIAQNFSQIKKSKFYKSDIAFSTSVHAIEKQIHQSGNEFLLSNYIESIDSRRAIDHQQFLGYKLT